MYSMRSALTLLALALPASVQAHAFWLQPDDYQIEVGADVAFDFRVGDGADADSWGLYWERVVSLRSYRQGGVVDHQIAITPTTETEQGGARFALDTPGTHIVAFESQSSFSDLEASCFNAYLTEEGLTAAAEARRANGQEEANGTELYSRRAKTLVQVGDERTDSVTVPIGQTLEIVPEANPYARGGAGPMPLRVFYRGRPLAGATVHFVDLDTGGDAIKRRTDGDGRVAFDLGPRGRWLFDVVWATPSPNDDRADFSTIFASLTVGRE